MMQTAQIEQIVTKVVETRLKEVVEDFVMKNEYRAKEMSLMERVVRVEEELKASREMFEIRFQASEKNQESLQREMIARFEAVDKRFEALQREMTARFEAVDKRFTMLQWLIGIVVGLPSITFTIIQLVKIF